MKTLLALVLFAFQLSAQEPYNAGLQNVRDCSVVVSVSDDDRVLLLNESETEKLVAINLRMSGLEISEDSKYSLVISVSTTANESLSRDIFAYNVAVALLETLPSNNKKGYIYGTHWEGGLIGLTGLDNRGEVLVAISKIVDSFTHNWKRDHKLIGSGF